MENKQFVGEGHYRDNNGNEYMSIWTYKKLRGIQPNDNSVNFEHAKEIICFDKIWGPFNQSPVFKEGYMYNVECLDNFFNS
jgi:hypothetical protein